MSGGEHEAIAIKPIGVLRVVPHHLIVQNVSHRSAAHGQTRVAGVRLLHGVNCQEPDCVDGLIHELGIGSLLEGLHGGGGADRETGCGGRAAPVNGSYGGRGGSFKAGEGGDGKSGGCGRGVELLGGAMAGDG